VASLVFTGGCNLTCPFCHNAGLVLEPEAYPDHPVDQLLADLKKREGFIDGVVISGGEPTLDGGLPAFLSQLKAQGLEVKLDTNGLVPEVVAVLLEQRLVDYVAVDVKTSLDRYGELHSRVVDTSKLKQTVALLKDASPVETEYRTTCIPQLVGAAEIDTIGELLQGVPLWVLQQYVPGHALAEEWQQFDVYSESELRTLAEHAARYAEAVQLRGL
jgi:pyruvate formate lyase activating enzyme